MRENRTGRLPGTRRPDEDDEVGDCKVGASAIIDGNTRVGEGTEIFPFASIGLPPQDLKYRGEDTRLTIGRRNVFRARTLAERPASLPELNLDHLQCITDDTGVLQHASFVVPRYAEGYCLDDNARALRLMVLLEQAGGGERRAVRALSSRYLAFVNHAFHPTFGRFRNFLTYARTWDEARGSENSHGRSLWALGTVVGRAGDPGRRTWPTTWFVPRVTGEGAFREVYSVMAHWGANHGVISYGHIGAYLITLASMLRIPVYMHNVDEVKIFRPRPGTPSVRQISRALTSGPVPTLDRCMANTSQRLKWYHEAKFGLFIHWGPYSVAGVEASWPIMAPDLAAILFGAHAPISEAEYKALPHRFNPLGFDPTAWVQFARLAGMRYMD